MRGSNIIYRKMENGATSCDSRNGFVLNYRLSLLVDIFFAYASFCGIGQILIAKCRNFSFVALKKLELYYVIFEMQEKDLSVLQKDWYSRYYCTPIVINSSTSGVFTTSFPPELAIDEKVT